MSLVRPGIAITVGDPAGIGPEIVFRALEAPPESATFRIFGNWNLTSQSLDACGMGVQIPVIEPAGLDTSEDPIVFVDVAAGDDAKLEMGSVSAVAGRAALASIEAAVDAIDAGSCHALVTAPIHKGAIRLAGASVPGHTELLAARAGLEHYGRDFAMYFDSPSLSVALLTVHVPLRDVPQAVQIDRIADIARLVDRELAKLDGSRPRIAVAGLNPHAGEDGMFGAEEREIEIAVESVRDEGLSIEGPFPADTLFHGARAGRFDVVLAMYHDQGLIPIKTMHFDEAVNVTLGLPYLRASVDHGTAFDIAGRGVADASAMRYAIRWTLRALDRKPRLGRSVQDGD